MANEMTIISNAITYEQLDAEAQQRVDAKVEELRCASVNDLLTYGIEAQTKVTQYANGMLTKINSSDKVEDIDGIIEDVMDVTKPFNAAPVKRNFFQRLFAVKEDTPKIDRSMFASKINTLVEAIEIQSGRLMADNIMYDDFISLLVENVNSISETIIALERYIEEVKERQAVVANSESQDMAIMLEKTTTNNLLDQLLRRLNMFRISKQESMQVAVSARVIQNNNVVLSDRLQTLLVVAVPILQNQILLKASMHDTQKGLDICDKVAETIDTATKQNAEHLKKLTGRISQSEDMPINGESVVAMSKDILSIATELKNVNSKAKKDLENMEEQLRQSDESLAELFNMLSVGNKEEE